MAVASMVARQVATGVINTTAIPSTFVLKIFLPRPKLSHTYTDSNHKIFIRDI